MEIDQSVYDLAKRSVELEAQCDKLNKEKTMLMEEVMIEYTKAKNKCGETEAKLREEKEKCTQLEIDLKAAAAELEDKAGMISKLEEENKTLEEEIVELLSIRHEALKRQKCQSEKDLEEDNCFEDKAGKISKLEEEKKMLLEEIMDLSTRNGALERQKRQSEMDLKERMDKEARNTEMEEKKYDKLLKKTWFLEKEISRLKKDKLDEDLLEAEKKRVAELEGVVLGLWKKIESLERAKKNKQAKDAKLNKEKAEEIKKISNKKMVVEAENRALKKQIKTLMEEKMDKDKMMLEREEAIKVLDRENEALEARKKELETELKTVRLTLILKTEKEVDGISGAPQNKGNIKTEALSAYKRA